MTRLLTTGYETGDVNEAGTNTVGSSMAITAANATPTPRAGSYCLKIANTSGAFWNTTYKTFGLPAAKTEVWLRFAFYAHPVLTPEFVIAQLQDTAAGAQDSLTYDASSGVLRVRLGLSNGAVLAVASTSFPVDTWHVIEWRLQITSTTVGVTEVWLDGNRVINFSGDVCATTTANVQFVLLGLPIPPNLGVAAGAYVAFDDIAVNDVAGTLNNARPQDGRVILLTPSGAGSSTQFVRGGTDTGANFSQVNELPPAMAQYVGSNTVGNRDLYALTDVGVAVSAINVVEAILLAQNSDAGGGSIAPTVKSGATINEATAIGLSTSAGYVTSRWETDPNTSAAWTIAAVNAAEAGATVR